MDSSRDILGNYLDCRETPLLCLPELAAKLEVSRIWLKDESQRCGLGSFKALGGAYAVGVLLKRRIQLVLGETVANGSLFSESALQVARTLEFVCASAGNHGLSVAFGAKKFGAKATIFIAETVSQGFETRLRDLGAEVVREGANYEASMAAALGDSQSRGVTLLSDSSWPGYTEIPRIVMDGYTVLADEMSQQFQKSGAWPTHLVLQAGVGGMAAAVTERVRQTWPIQPKIVVVEPEAAACLKGSFAAGKPVTASGPCSNMGRLDCKEPSLLAFQILHQADEFLTVSDTEAQQATEELERYGVHSTPSGVAGLAAIKFRRVPFGDGARVVALITEGV